MTHPHPAVSPPAVIDTALPAGKEEQEMPIIAIDIPIMYEDEGQETMGDADIHTQTIDNLKPGVIAHLAARADLRVFADINTYYHRVDRWAYFSADLMAAAPSETLPERPTSYRIGVSGPAPVLAIEVLSRRSFQQQDLTNKPVLYSELGIAEYILVDVTGEFLPERLLLRRLQNDGAWSVLQDPDGGVTSRLGFRIVIEDDGHVRVIDHATGKRYLRLKEGQPSADALATELQARDERIRVLEAELTRLRGQQPPEKKE
jgi:Putative restriction endonuclease